MSTRLVHAPNTRSARSSRRCSCGTRSLGSSGRVPRYWNPPSTLPAACGPRPRDTTHRAGGRRARALRRCRRAPGACACRWAGAWSPPGAMTTESRCTIGHEILDLVVAEGPEELRRHDHRAGGPLGIGRGVEGDEPVVSAGVGGREARRGAGALLAGDRPAPRLRRRPDHRSAGDLFDRQRTCPDAVGEPARIGHFVDRVDVLRPDVAVLPAGGDGHVVREVVEETDVVLLGAGRVAGLRRRRQRVVGVEFLFGAADWVERRDEQAADRECKDRAPRGRAGDGTRM